MTLAILAYAISCILVFPFMRDYGDSLNEYISYTLTEKLQASFLLFIFVIYWIVLIITSLFN